MLRQMTLWDMTSVISSPVSVDGALHSGLPVGPMTGQYGQDHARANHSAQQERNRECRTNGTSGRSGTASSASATLQSSLASRLRLRLTTDGSTLFAMTWKTKDTPSGRSVCLLRASARRISDNGCGSWPTPQSRDGKSGGQSKRAMGETRHGSNLNDFCKLAAWATPRANDAKKQGYMAQDPRNGLPAQVLEPGTRINRLGRMLTGFIAETNAGGQLNPELSRWLMGYPAEWAHCRPTAMQSSRKSRRK